MFSLDTTGVPSVVAQAVDSLAHDGICLISAIADPDAELVLKMNRLLLDRGIRGGSSSDSVSQALIPRLIDFCQRGWFPVERIVREYPFEAINSAVADIDTGAAVKPVLMMR